MAKQKLLEATISGTYRTADRKVVPFKNIKITLPFCDHDVAQMHLKGRYASLAISNDERFKERVNSIREVFVDELVEVEGDALSYVGKDICQMTFEELQDLATAKDLRLIPNTRSGRIQEARNRAYAAYSTHVLGKVLDHRAEGFDATKLKAIIVDSKPRRELSRRLTNEEVISQEQANTTMGKSQLTLDDLKDLMKEKGIPFHPNIGYDAAYKKLYGQEAA